MQEPIYDFAAIGLGPFNLGLACLAEPIEGLQGVFLDENEDFNWHPGMLLEDATLQTPFMSDLVTLTDPTNPYSFLNYLKEQGRIYAFYIREDFFPPRREYNAYCRWAARKLSNIRFNSRVEWIEHEADDRCYRVRCVCPKTGRRDVYRARKLVLGTGTSPYVPGCFQGLEGPAVHSSEYLANREHLRSRGSITVVGSGQSAAEIFYDLLQDIDRAGYALTWITRSPRFFPLEYTKLTLEMTSPDYVDYFHSLPPEQRRDLVARQKRLYKGISGDLVNAIYDLLYTKSVAGDLPVELRTNSEVTEARHDPGTGSTTLRIHQREQDRCHEHTTEGLILATGYTYRLPGFIEGIRDRLAWDAGGRLDVGRNYSVDRGGSEVFVQNAELHTHGFVTPDLGMGSYRNAYIINEMTGVEHYPLERRIAFQRFGVSDDERTPPEGERREAIETSHAEA